jgi:hypothetical protein
MFTFSCYNGVEQATINIPGNKDEEGQRVTWHVKLQISEG